MVTMMMIMILSVSVRTLNQEFCTRTSAFYVVTKCRHSEHWYRCSLCSCWAYAAYSGCDSLCLWLLKKRQPFITAYNSACRPTWPKLINYIWPKIFNSWSELHSGEFESNVKKSRGRLLSLQRNDFEIFIIVVTGKVSCIRRGSNLDRPVVQSVARHYTDWATRLTWTFCGWSIILMAFVTMYRHYLCDTCLLSPS
jgi:hypothetical protein